MQQESVINVNQIGMEDEKHPSTSRTENNIRHQKFSNWVLGLALSFIPILIRPVVDVLGDTNAGAVFIIMFSNTSILYICVSQIVSALNDLAEVEYRGGQLYWRRSIYVIVLSFAIALYTLIVVLQMAENEINQIYICVLNIFFLSISIFLCLQQYIAKGRRR